MPGKPQLYKAMPVKPSIYIGDLYEAEQNEIDYLHSLMESSSAQTVDLKHSAPKDKDEKKEEKKEEKKDWKTEVFDSQDDLRQQPPQPDFSHRDPG